MTQRERATLRIRLGKPARTSENAALRERSVGSHSFLNFDRYNSLPQQMESASEFRRRRKRDEQSQQ
jgi:hypothetical protein